LLPSSDDEQACHLYAAGTEFIDESKMIDFDCKKVLAIAMPQSPVAGRIKRRLTKRDIAFSVMAPQTLLKMEKDELNNTLLEADTILYLCHEGLESIGFDGKKLQAAVDEQTSILYDVFKFLIPSLVQMKKRIVFPVAMDGVFGVLGSGEHPMGAFPVGFARCLDKELRECIVQIFDCENKDWAEIIDSNIMFFSPYLEVGITESGRITPVMAQVEQADSREVNLEKGDLVLVTGGARGIVFECVRALAQYTGCKLVLTGRTKMAEGQPSWLNTPADRIDEVIRAMEIELVKKEGKKLPEAKKIAGTRRAQWEVAKNLELLADLNIIATYEQCDVSNDKELSGLILKLNKLQPIVGIVHGSGIQKSAMIVDLPGNSIDLTLKTKLTPLFTMIDNLDWSKLKVFSAFGSIAGLFGNAGQSDYALGNDMLAWMVKELKVKYPHINAQTIEWTAWSGTGMVTEQESKRFADAGLIALTVETGVPLFMEGIAGCEEARLAAFNAAAGFASGRKFLEYKLSARPRTRLIEDKKDRNWF
jgi:NAD(P)-dependent dehydrogenase (short-subunit alcohol dehydrogenase family)